MKSILIFLLACQSVAALAAQFNIETVGTKACTAPGQRIELLRTDRTTQGHGELIISYQCAVQCAQADLAPDLSCTEEAAKLQQTLITEFTGTQSVCSHQDGAILDVAESYRDIRFDGTDIEATVYTIDKNNRRHAARKKWQPDLWTGRVFDSPCPNGG